MSRGLFRFSLFATIFTLFHIKFGAMVTSTGSGMAFTDWPLVVVSDEPERTAASAINFLWTTFTRFEPAADIHSAGSRIDRNHITYSFPIVVDARRQPGFPAELFCSPEIPL